MVLERERKNKMGSKIMSSLCILSCLFANSFCQESSVIRKVTDVQDLRALVQTKRVRPPSSYLMKIQPFSLLSKATQSERYESAVFEAGGYNWKLVLYPNGNKDASGTNYISLYLSIQHSNFTSKSNNWEVYADVKFFIYSQVDDTYLTLTDNQLKRFHVANTERGFAQALPLATFNAPTNGYLLNDYACFGTEVYVTELTKNWERFYSVSPTSDEAKFTWKILNFSKLDQDSYGSEEFTAAGITWKMRIMPKAYDEKTKKDWLGVFLEAYGSQNRTQLNKETLANYKMRLLDRKASNHVQKEYTTKVLPPHGSGDLQFISLTDLQNPSRGFLVNDSVVVQAEILRVSGTKYFP